MSLTDDLARLKELDPAIYEELQIKFASLGNYIEDDNFDVVLDETIKRAGNPAMWIIQGVLQEAIVARGWLLEQSTFTAKPSAKIWKPGDAVWMLYIRYAESHVAALLACYIAALEAQA